MANSSKPRVSPQNSEGKNIPFDVIADDVLWRSPVKSLMRFRCVSKQWCDLISEPQFVQKHFNASNQSDRRMLLVKGILNEESTPSCYFTVDFQSDGNDDDTDNDDGVEFSVGKLGFPTNNGPSRVMGSCNGLVLLAFADSMLALWNPSARTYRYYNCSCANFYGYSLTGFGYDPSVDDYMAIFGNSTDNSITMWIFCFRNRVWKHKKKIPYLVVQGSEEGVSLDGVPHWILCRRDRIVRVLVCYDVEEGLKEVPIPSKHFLHFKSYHLSVLRGCLCIYCYGADGLLCWMMKEYFVKESWTCLFTISNLPRVPFGFRPKPLFFTSKGEIVISISRDELVICDPVRKTHVVRKIRLPDASVERIVAVYVDSLVAPSVGEKAEKHC